MWLVSKPRYILSKRFHEYVNITFPNHLSVIFIVTLIFIVNKELRIILSQKHEIKLIMNQKKSSEEGLVDKIVAEYGVLEGSSLGHWSPTWSVDWVSPYNNRQKQWREESILGIHPSSSPVLFWVPSPLLKVLKTLPALKNPPIWTSPPGLLVQISCFCDFSWLAFCLPKLKLFSCLLKCLVGSCQFYPCLSTSKRCH